MTFFRQASAAAILITLTLSLQIAGMAVLMVRFTSPIIALHLSHIVLWTTFYHWQCFPSWETAFYFSTSSYTTVGYRDVVLSQTWRTLGPVESIVGVLMSGLSVSVLFAIVTRLVEHETRS